MKAAWFTDNDDLPIDVLSRLPTIILLGLKCVSKEWQRLISDPCFVRQQLNSKEPVCGFFFQERFQWCNADIKSISYIKTPNNSKKDTIIRRAVFDFLPEDVVLLAISNGLICCRNIFPCSQPTVYICNPLIKEWVTLEWPGPDKSISLGMVFDPFKDSIDKSTDFKVVGIHEIVTETEDSYFSMFSFKLYSSKTREWTESKQTCVCKHSLGKNQGVCIKGGALFWLTDGDEILMFDSENDLPWLVKVPFPLSEFDIIPEMCIGESEGKLHYVLICKEGLQVWALDDYFEFVWALKYFIGLDVFEKENSDFLSGVRYKVASHLSADTDPYMQPLAYKDGALFLKVGVKVFLYNFETRKMEELCELAVLGPNSMFSPVVLPYSMSLVPLARS